MPTYPVKAKVESNTHCEEERYQPAARNLPSETLHHYHENSQLQQFTMRQFQKNSGSPIWGRDERFGEMHDRSVFL